MTRKRQQNALLTHYHKYLLFETPFGRAKPYFQDTCAGSGTIEELRCVRGDAAMLGALREWFYGLNKYGHRKFIMAKDNDYLGVREGDICIFYAQEITPIAEEEWDKKLLEKGKKLQDYCDLND